MGAALETLTVQPHPNSKPRQVRISSRVKAAIEAMVEGSLSREDAAKHAGLTDNALYIAMRKPEVLAYRNDRMRVLRTSETARSIKRVADLAHSASSEAVKFDANKYLLATDPDTPITPLNRSESTINHKGLGPGLQIIIAAPEPVTIDGRVIGSQARELQYISREKDLAEPVPHPSWANAQMVQRSTVESAGQSSLPAQDPGGKTGDARFPAGTTHALSPEISSPKKSVSKKRGRKLFAHKDWL